jgi:hypothetical protein
MKTPAWAALIAALIVSSSALADKIGVASSVTNDVQGIVGGAPKRLAVGSELFANQRVRTGDASAAQLLFLDETSVSVGPKSEITLDRFVFNPSRGAGNVVLSASKGAFRFVTGSQNPTHYSIKTPVATIGVRGTIVDVSTVTRNGVTTTVVTLIEGRVIITAFNGQTLNLDRPGSSYVVKSNGSVQGPITGDGTITTFLNNPQRLDIPDNRLDLSDILGPLGPKVETPQQSPGSGPGCGTSCNSFFH